MIPYSYKRAPGGPRYSPTQRQAARALAAAAAAPTLSPEALEAMVDEDGIEIVCDVLFELESNRLRRPVTSVLQLNGADVAPFSGNVATLANGKRVASPDEPPVVFSTTGGLRSIKQTWADPRPVNVVELAEDTTMGIITNVTVKTLDAGGVVTVRAAGVSSAGGLISVPIAPYWLPVTCYGVIVELNAGTLAAGSPRFGIVEVDAMLVWDISDEVVEVDVEFAAEQEPGTSPDPYGTYAASEMSLIVPDTDGKWSSPANTSLDAGHRVEVAFGVRYDETAFVEVARNDVTQPQPASLALATGWTGLAGTGVVAAPWDPARKAYKTIGNGVSTAYVFSGRSARAWSAGETVYARIRVGSDDPSTWFSSRIHVRSTNAYFGANAVTQIGADPRVVELAFVLPTNVAANDLDVATLFYRDGGGTALLAATTGYAGDVHISTAPIVDYFDGGTTDTDDEAYEWTGTADASTSRHLTRTPTGNVIEELLPAGVFYSEPFDTDSEATTVTINGTDRIGRDSDTPLSEPVVVGGTLGTLVRALAARYLDLAPAQVVIEPTIAAEVIPYAYPSGPLGTYLADIAKAYGGVLHMDALDRLSLARRSTATDDVVAEIDRDVSLVKFTRPPGADVTTSQVVVNAAPLTLGADDDLWSMPSGGIQIPTGAAYPLICTYSSNPAVNGYVTGIVADGSYTVAAAAYYGDRAELTISNTSGHVLTVADLHIRGNPLVESALTSRAVHAPSVARYGPKELTVDARLVQTQARVDALAAYLLDAFRSLDDNGTRRRPDLTFQALGLLHLAVGDRLTLADATKGLGGDYMLLSRRLTYAGGALLISDARVRQAPGYDVLTYDSGELYDDGHVYGF